MKITPTTQTIGNFFNTLNEQFFVPPYQRRYAWGISQLDALFNDINLLKDGDTHLLGTVVLLADTHSPNINRLELVDGQQRITTLCILLKVLQDNLNKSDSPDEIREIRKYLNCRSGETSEQKIILGDLDHNDFSRIMHSKIGSELENKRLKQAVDFFSERIRELGPGIVQFYRKLTDQIELIRLDIGHARDAYKLFETINNRGLKLSAADIVKNFLLGHASILGEEILEDVKEEWRHLILNLDKLDHSDMDRFFRQYLMGKLKLKIPKSRLIEEFKNYYYLNIQEAEKLSDYQARLELIGRKKYGRPKSEQTEDYEENGEDDIAGFNKEAYHQKKIGIRSFAKEIRECSAIYESLVSAEDKNPKIARGLYALKRIEATPAYTFLIHAFWRGIDDGGCIKILGLIETFILRRQICEYRTSELDDIFPRLCGLAKKDLVESVKNGLAEYLPNDKEFQDKFPFFSNKGAEERAKHILARVENHLQGDSEEIDIRGGAEVHLEHIIPQTISGRKAREENGGDWIRYLGKNKDRVKELHKKYVNRIGNLSLLAEKLNIRASNNPFKSKGGQYKKSAFQLNKDLSKNYNKFRFPQVDERSEMLAEIAIKIWKF